MANRNISNPPVVRCLYLSRFQRNKTLGRGVGVNTTALIKNNAVLAAFLEMNKSRRGRSRVGRPVYVTPNGRRRGRTSGQLG